MQDELRESISELRRRSEVYPEACDRERRRRSFGHGHLGADVHDTEGQDSYLQEAS